MQDFNRREFLKTGLAAFFGPSSTFENDSKTLPPLPSEMSPDEKERFLFEVLWLLKERIDEQDAKIYRLEQLAEVVIQQYFPKPPAETDAGEI